MADTHDPKSPPPSSLETLITRLRTAAGGHRFEIGEESKAALLNQAADALTRSEAGEQQYSIAFGRTADESVEQHIAAIRGIIDRAESALTRSEARCQQLEQENEDLKNKMQGSSGNTAVPC